MSQPRPKLLSDWVNNPVTEIIKFWQQEEKESISYQRCQGEINEMEKLAGWRLYVTNASKDRLTLTEASKLSSAPKV